MRLGAATPPTADVSNWRRQLAAPIGGFALLEGLTLPPAIIRAESARKNDDDSCLGIWISRHRSAFSDIREGSLRHDPAECTTLVSLVLYDRLHRRAGCKRARRR